MPSTKKIFFISLLILTITIGCSNSNKNMISHSSLVKVSQDFLEAVKKNQDYSIILNKLGNLKFETLVQNLKLDKKKLTFWINIYNATTQFILINNPEYFQNKSDFYKHKAIIIAGIKFSLDDIEHGILRKNAHKLSLGYLKKFLTPKHIQSLMVEKVDPRIHFALNCGAKSCPPVLFFEEDKINDQLDLATKNYLDLECEFKDNKLMVPILFSWFRGDFGGIKGIYQFLVKYEILKKGEKPKLIYKEYDWTMIIGNYQY
jgi:hypothetical protein